MCPRRSNEDRSRTTRARLVAAARRSFAARGTAATTLAGVAAEAGVSTGAVYHHWAGKEQLLASVVTDVHIGLAREIDAGRPDPRPDPLAEIEHAAGVFLRRCADADVGRLLLVEAPAVLGETWHELDRRWWQRPTTALLRRAARTCPACADDPEGLATALLGSLTALGRAVATGGATTPSSAEAAFRALVEGLRSPPAGP